MELSVGPNVRAINIAQNSMAVRADNLANLQTEGYQRREAVISAGPQMSVRDASPGTGTADDLVGLRQDLHLAKVNMGAIKRADDMLGSLLDVFA
jgi:flagellar basal body rod protein FlgF